MTSTTTGKSGRTIPKATAEQRDRLLRSVGRQPAPELIRTAEQALAVIKLDPDPNTPETAYALGYFDGRMAGLFFSFGTWTAEQVERHRRFYGVDFAYVQPLPLAAALVAEFRRPSTSRTRLLGVCGYLQGFADATADEPEALTCGVCTRRLFADLDGAHRCEITGAWLCEHDASSACDSRNGQHQRECYGDDSP